MTDHAHREHPVPIAGRASNAKKKKEGGGAMPARLNGNNTCTIQTYTNSRGARVGHDIDCDGEQVAQT